MAIFVDTNILLYSLGGIADEESKAMTAQEILDRSDLVLSAQVLQEFYVQATRPTRPGAISHDLAAAFVSKWRRFPILNITVELVETALAMRAAHRFSYWDCAVIAAAAKAGCDTLYTEDMSHGRTISGVRIVNPFL